MIAAADRIDIHLAPARTVGEEHRDLIIAFGNVDGSMIADLKCPYSVRLRGRRPQTIVIVIVAAIALHGLFAPHRAEGDRAEVEDRVMHGSDGRGQCDTVVRSRPAVDLIAEIFDMIGDQFFGQRNQRGIDSSERVEFDILQTSRQLQRYDLIDDIVGGNAGRIAVEGVIERESSEVLHRGLG